MKLFVIYIFSLLCFSNYIQAATIINSDIAFGIRNATILDDGSGILGGVIEKRRPRLGNQTIL